MSALAPCLELRLLLACARLRLEPADAAAIDAALEGDLDWERVMHLARWHGLRPLLERHLVGRDARIPRAVLVELWAETAAIARRNRALDGELGRIGTLLDAAGVGAVPYKGPTLARAAYGDLALREFGDLDILVARRDVLRAREALCKAGYVAEYPLRPDVERAFLDSGAQYHLVLRSRDLGHLVELHWKTDPDYPVERMDDASWWEGTRQSQGPPSLCPEELMLVLCIHGSKHGWASLGWLVDIAELLRRDAGLDWDGIIERVAALGCARRVGLGLRLAADWLDAPLGPAAAALARSGGIEALLPAVEARMLAPDPGPPGPFEGLRQALALHDRARPRIRLILHGVFLPSLVEWTRWPLPRALFFAYPVLRMGRLAGKYAKRGLEGLSGGRKLHS